MADVPQLKEAFRAGRRHPQPDRRGAVRQGRPRHAQPGQDDQFRDPLRQLGVGHRGPARRAEGRRQSDHRPLFRALPGHPRVTSTAPWRSRASGASRETLFGRKTHFMPNIRSPNPVDPRRGRARRDQRADPGHERRPHQARDGTDGQCACRGRASTGFGCSCRCTTSWCSKCPTGGGGSGAAVIKRVMATAAEPAIKLDVPLDVEVGWGEHWGEAH